MLANVFLEELIKKYQKKELKLSRAYLNFLMKQDWPGNVRQLRNQIEKDVILTESDVLDLGDKYNTMPSEIHETLATHTIVVA